jgi:hypothetical protein
MSAVATEMLCTVYIAINVTLWNTDKMNTNLSSENANSNKEVIPPGNNTGNTGVMWRYFERFKKVRHKFRHTNAGHHSESFHNLTS